MYLYLVWILSVLKLSFFISNIFFKERGPIAYFFNVLDCNIILSKFELQSQLYIHFRTNTPEKSMNSLIPPNYGLNSTTTVLL